MESNDRASRDAQKTLFYIPVIHTANDLGSLSDSVQQKTFEKFGKKYWQDKERLIEAMWLEIREKIEGLNLEYKKVRLYQDGLPVCDRELELVTEIAGDGSHNHRLLLSLVEKGAVLMGTESGELLLQEYNLIKQILAAEDGKQAGTTEESQKELGDNLLLKRDCYIAERINDTLGAGETGLLFIGMMHSVDKFLNDDIEVIYPLFLPHSMERTDEY